MYELITEHVFPPVFVGSAALKVGPSKLNASKLLITESRSTVLPLKKCDSVIVVKH